jgi:phosphoglycerate dehydrogenase-like enzyme
MHVVYCDASLGQVAEAMVVSGLSPHTLVFAERRGESNLAATGFDPRMKDAEIVFGQPSVAAIAAAPNLRWVHLTSAGYTRYDTEDARNLLRERDIALTTSSTVYAEPCAEHVLAFMLAGARRLRDAFRTQGTTREWPSAKLRQSSRLMRRQRVVILGFGAIGRRLVELLAPFDMDISILRRRPDGREPFPTIDHGELPSALRGADHVVNLLPENESTRGLLTHEHFSAMGPTSAFYNVGRGTTVSEHALADALRDGSLGCAFLDVTAVEPLPQGSSLWGLDNCTVTPHSAGGHDEEMTALAAHFLDNLERYACGAPLIDRVV